jgi:hypothetical protein
VVCARRVSDPFLSPSDTRTHTLHNPQSHGACCRPSSSCMCSSSWVSTISHRALACASFGNNFRAFGQTMRAVHYPTRLLACTLCLLARFACSCSFWPPAHCVRARVSAHCTHLWLARLHTPKCTATSGRARWYSDDDSATCSTSSRSWPCLSPSVGVAQVRRDTVADNVDPRPPHRAGSGVGGH